MTNTDDNTFMVEADDGEIIEHREPAPEAEPDGCAPIKTDLPPHVLAALKGALDRLDADALDKLVADAENPSGAKGIKEKGEAARAFHARIMDSGNTELVSDWVEILGVRIATTGFQSTLFYWLDAATAKLVELHGES